MGIRCIQTATLEDLLAASNEAIQEARNSGAVVELVVPSHAWGEQRKIELANVAPLGVNVQTHVQLIAGLWDLFGDGSTLVDAGSRRVLLRPLIVQVGLMESTPSPQLITELCAFVQEAVASGVAPAKNLTESQAKVMELVSLYEHKLELECLCESVQAEEALAAQGACTGMCFVFECPDMQSAHVRRFVDSVAACADVVVVEQRLQPGFPVQHAADDELASLRQHLFTGNGSLEACGQVHVGEACGGHVQEQVTARLIREIHEREHIAFNDMLICLGVGQNPYPRLHETLAQAGIPFVSHFELPCARVSLGAAFAQLEQVVLNPDDELGYEPLVDFMGSPYAGIDPRDARALQMRWRERAHSTAQNRLEDIRNGFAQGNATAHHTKERFEPLVKILDASRADRVRMMFENARNAHVGADALIDDRAAAETLLDYIELCDRYNCVPDLEEMANLSVNLVRRFGKERDALRIVPASKMDICRAQAIVLPGLDSAAYPMASQDGPFDELMAVLGIARSDTFADDQRLLLLNAIERSGSQFAFTRATHDASGEESCPSALFEELVSVYRGVADEEADLPVAGIPTTLAPFSFALSESDAFFGVDDKDTSHVPVERGELEREWSKHNLLFDLQEKALPFSPTGLEDYYRCPYRWFTSRRVGYNGMDNAFDAASQGNLVHATMERFYKDLKAAGFARVTPECLPQALEIAKVSFAHQVEHDKNKTRGGLYLNTKREERQCAELLDLICALVERDAEFLPGFTPTYFELTLGRGTGAMLEYAGVPVRGKVDRIDVDAQGNAVIVDYKLSGLSEGYGFKQEEELPLRIQTDIYATLVQRHFEMLGTPLRVVGSVYRSYSKNSMRGVFARGIDWGALEELREDKDALPRSSSSESYEEYLVHVENEVAARMDRLRQGDISPDPIADGVCEYCKAIAFCPKGGA